MYIYLPMVKSIRTKVDLRTLAVYQSRGWSIWHRIKDDGTILKQAQLTYAKGARVYEK